MPHATKPNENEDAPYQEALRLVGDQQNGFDLNALWQPSEKADDAIDYESDDSLADDEDAAPTAFSAPQGVANASPPDGLIDFMDGVDQELPDLTNTNGELDGDDLDDLFGGGPSSPVDFRFAPEDATGPSAKSAAGDDFNVDDLFGGPSEDMLEVDMQLTATSSVEKPAVVKSIEVAPPEPVMSKEEQLQRDLFAMSSRHALAGSDYPPAPPENQEELLASLWPKFERNTVPRFMDLLPPKVAHWRGQLSLKPPKPVPPNKVGLELAIDQEKLFRSPNAGYKRSYDEMDQQLIRIPALTSASDADEDEVIEVESDYENEPVGNVSWQDLQILCQEWNMHTEDFSQTNIRIDPVEVPPTTNFDDHDDLFREVDENRKPKKQKTAPTALTLAVLPQWSVPALQDIEYATAKVAKHVMLDLNDPMLLVDIQGPQAANPVKRLQGPADRRSGRAAFSKTLNQRYNISNDEAYELLKENHQNKVRSTLGVIRVDHSMPALRLQWPYYKTALEKQEARSFHRPLMSFHKNEPITFGKTRLVKRKNIKGKDTKTLFESAKDLSLADNSVSLLLEYSEEHPSMMSNFGMGNKIVNFYRKRNIEDKDRPKGEIGETLVLLPQDKSPLSFFGSIDPGEFTASVHNHMFRAPIFKQEPKPTDFLIVRNHTGIDGVQWCLRSIDHVNAVGQEFPSVDVPGPHSRKVTTASKNRLKMISYRRLKRNKPHRISVAEVTEHFTDSNDMQNRQKMKEFMAFNKEHKEWEMKSGESIPNEDKIREMVKPEDVCLLEAMQVGQQHLTDAGFSKGDDDVDDDEGKENQSIEQLLAPWCTSRNFLQATQGKAMLQLHGEGDPTGRGEAFSFIKTSMKGGFKALGESVEDKLDAKKLKDLGGHSYNVAKQQKAYEDSIRRIWEAQKRSLSSTLEHDEVDPEDDLNGAEESFGYGATPRSELQGPAAFRRRDDETGSQFSKFSTDSQTGKILRIAREVKGKYGELEKAEEIIRDPRVIRQYIKARHAKEDGITQLSEIKPTGNAEKDMRNQQRLKAELDRLYRNQERRVARDKQKGIITEVPAASPDSPSGATGPAGPVAPPVKGTGTQRKCANCGMQGHIKTNKKLCPYFQPHLRY